MKSIVHCSISDHILNMPNKIITLCNKDLLVLPLNHYYDLPNIFYGNKYDNDSIACEICLEKSKDFIFK